MRFFSSLGSRVTGYEGCDIAADYIYNKFLEYGLENVHFQYFNVTVPIDCGGKITVFSPVKKVIRAYPLWPNVVATSSINASGYLIYAGNLNLEELNEKNITGNFVLAEFNSHDNWINAAKFGAKGVIFIEPYTTVSSEAEAKVLDIPVNFPRLWISREDGEFLLQLLSSGNNVFIHVESKMIWRKVRARNVIGFVNGTVYGYNIDVNGTITYKKLPASKINTPEEATIPHYEAISIIAHYDSFSYVPSLAPGADDSAGISALLEFAKFFSKNKPRRTIIFIAFSGFWQGLEGSRAYVDENFGVYIEGSTLPWDLTRIHFNLDYSSDIDALALMYAGYYYQAWSTRWTDSPLARASTVAAKAREYYAEIVRQTGKNYRFYDAVVNFWYEFSPILYMLDIEPFMLAGSTAVAFRTAHAWRSRWKTPFDTIDKVNWENLKPQIELSLCLLAPFANEDKVQRAYPLYRGTAESAAPFSFGSLLVHVVEYDIRTGWYKPVPNALVRIKLMQQEEVRAPGGLGIAASSPYLQDLIVMTDENGFARVAGLARCISVFEPVIWIYKYDAYVLDENGNILYATDRGTYGGAKFPLMGSLNIEPYRQTIPVFKCGSLVLFDLMDPTSFTMPFRIELFTIPGYTMPIFYGGAFSLVKPIAALFLKPEEAYIVKSVDQQYNLVYLLTNATCENPEGSGFTLRAGETKCIPVASYRSSLDIYFLNSFRYQTLVKYGVGDIEAFKAQESTEFFVKKAEEALNNNSFSKFYVFSTTALQVAVKAYLALSGLIYGGLITISVIFAVVIPATLCLERLVFSYQGIKRLIATIVLLVLLLLPLYTFHPSFSIAHNTILALLGTGVTILLIPVLWLSINSGIKFFAELRKRIKGVHAAEIERMGYFGMAISLGIENMRRRKLRTFLISLTLFLVVFSSVIFTSFSSFTTVKETEESGMTLYTGALLRRAKIQVTNPLTWELYNYIKALFPDCVVTAMAWYYPPRQTLTIFYGNKSYTITLKAALMALAPEEALTEILTPESLWFLENDENVIMISDKVARELGVQVGGKVNILGMDFLVRGIFISDVLEQILDLDQKPRLPLDTLAPEEEQMTLEKRIPAWAVLIVPFSLGRKLNFQIFTISVRAPSLERIKERVYSLASNTKLDIYMGAEGKYISSRKMLVINLVGWNIIFMPLILASLIILSTVLGAIYERTKEIVIYSALGLSPSTVSAIFAMEIFIYVPIGSAIGYIAGISCNRLLYAAGFYPEGFFVNFSSIYTVLSIGITALTCLIALLYPIYKASRLVTPSLERTWKIPTKPIGDEWIVPIPIHIDEFREVRALLRYLYEFFVNYPKERGGVFMLESVELREDEREKKASLFASIRLPPYDIGIAQTVEIPFLWSEEVKKYLCEINVKRTAGLVSAWEAANRKFFDEIRKQILLWKVLRSKDKEKYYAMLAQ
ncbi:MAG: M28 family peptidase [Candidatus Bathyarchaeia archaeon]